MLDCLAHPASLETAAPPKRLTAGVLPKPLSIATAVVNTDAKIANARMGPPLSSK